ncbi:MAG: NUDIX hydrolase [Deltaproteobacteria bacterium]|nr:NUDIX hydrolase [Deltaproteobacteria bacterium]MBW2418437.1 NUDIX hydrolase [Deltaproteobacteria bacterium]
MSAEAPSYWIELLDRAWRVGLRAAYWSLRVWWFLRRPTLESAFVAVWRGDELLLIRNSYRRGVTIPSGGIDSGETPREAARRELEEEVGISVSGDALEPSCEVVMPFECKQDHGHFFELHLDPSDPRSVEIDRREVVWADFCHEAQLAEQPLSPQVRAYLAQRRAEFEP